jgi:hypothetical protein
MTLTDIFPVADMTDAIKTLATDAGVYVLALWGALTTLSVGIALLGRAKKGVVSAVRG